MRVMQIMAGGPHGGAEAFFERLAVALHKKGIEQRLIIRRDAERAGRLRAAGLDPLELRFGPWWDVRTGAALARELHRFAPQVALTWMSRASAALPPRDSTRDKVVRIGRLGGYYDLKYYSHCDHLIGNTRDIVAYLQKSGWPSERAHYVPNFVDAAPAPPADRRDLPEGAALALALGRFHRNKAFDVLLAAVAKAPSVHLWLAGEGDLRATLEADVRRLGIGDRVRFLGWRSDVGALMAASDMEVCSSRHEPLGNVVIEAWAQRRPVVATASQGPKALITDGTNGLLTPVDSAGALADAINRVIADEGLRYQLAREGFATYERNFTEAAVVANYRSFFEKVASSPSSRASRR